MRSIVWVSAVLIGFGCVAAAVAFEPGCSTCRSCQGTGFGAPPCAAPFYGTPGCCECPPGPCDNAWDGYCKHKAYWQAIWHNVGTGVYGGRCRTSSCAAPAACCPAPSVAQPTPLPGDASPQPAPKPAPPVAEPPVALPPAPEPVAEQAAFWRWSMPWTR